jgi:hypothetical protein
MKSQKNPIETTSDFRAALIRNDFQVQPKERPDAAVVILAALWSHDR